MSQHALHVPLVPFVETPVRSIADVLIFGSNGVAENHVSQELADELAAIIDGFGITWLADAPPPPSSPHCSAPIELRIDGVTEPLHLLCLLPDEHDGEHDAEPKRKPSPRPRKTVTS